MGKKTIEVKGLRKSFGKKEVLKGVSFSINEGQILALLGPNGAGKTTTVNILSTLLAPNGGSATVAGYDVVKNDKEVRGKIGLTGQFAAVDEYLTGRENIELIGKLYHLEKFAVGPRAKELLEQFDLIEAGDKPAKTYSGGMKRRLDLAMSLVASPPILFLDEPTTGLDPRSRIGLWNTIKNLAKNGTTILLTTQYMEEADFLADNIVVLDHGKIIAEGTVNELKSRAGTERIEIIAKDKSGLNKIQKLLGKDCVVDEDNLSFNLPAKAGVKSLQNVLTDLDKARISVDSAGIRRPTLDDVFLALTGRATEVEVETKKK